MIRNRPEKNTVNPPGQVQYIPGPDTIKHNVEQYKKYEKSRNEIDPLFEKAHYQDGRDLFPEKKVLDK